MTGQNGGAQFFDALGDVQSDALLALIAMANADTRPNKIDVGVGVYRDGAGNTPILRAVKAAGDKATERSYREQVVKLWESLPPGQQSPDNLEAAKTSLAALDAPATGSATAKH